MPLAEGFSKTLIIYIKIHLGVTTHMERNTPETQTINTFVFVTKIIHPPPSYQTT